MTPQSKGSSGRDVDGKQDSAQKALRTNALEQEEASIWQNKRAVLDEQQENSVHGRSKKARKHASLSDVSDAAQPKVAPSKALAMLIDLSSKVTSNTCWAESLAAIARQAGSGKRAGLREPQQLDDHARRQGLIDLIKSWLLSTGSTA